MGVVDDATPCRVGAAARDVRRARGERRRSALIAATLAVVERNGAAGVSHRAIAAAAGVSPSSAVYYFATLDDLLVAALAAAAVDEFVAQLDALRSEGRDGVQAVAELIASAQGSGRRRALAEWELTLLAARRPSLRAAAGRWRTEAASVALEHTDDPLAVEAFLAAADGVCARLLLSEEPVDASEVRAILERALGRRPNQLPSRS